MPKAKKKDNKKNRAAALDQASASVAELNGTSEDSEPMSRKEFERKLKPLHVELVKLQLWAQHAGLRAVVIFEGRDAAGKGGAIKAITERVSPRVFRIVALPIADRAREDPDVRAALHGAHARRGRDRPVRSQLVQPRRRRARDGLLHRRASTTRSSSSRRSSNAPSSSSGIILIKYWFEVSQELQTERFQERIDDGRKIWKLSGMDLESHHRWYDFSRARDAMFAATDTEISPWYVVNADDPRRARLNCITHLLSKIPYQEVAARARSSSASASRQTGTWSRSGDATSCPKCIDAGLKRRSTA